MAHKLEVRNLRISFRTNNGTVKAVRDIDFTLDQGQTLAIVGESGSGKSVTARAIMGILAGNAIVEAGEIFYDGMDMSYDQAVHIRKGLSIDLTATHDEKTEISRLALFARNDRTGPSDVWT